MSAQILSLFRKARPSDWSQQELAEFYRVEAALVQAGLRVETDRGVTDEGDPWFVFCRADDGEVVIHFARFDGRYVIGGPAYHGASQGPDFGALVSELVDRHPLVQVKRDGHRNVVFHPMALLVAVVATAFFKSGEVQAAESPFGQSSGGGRAAAGVGGGGAAGGALSSVTLDARHVAVVMAAVLFALDPLVAPQDDSTGSSFGSVVGENADAGRARIASASLDLDRHEIATDLGDRPSETHSHAIEGEFATTVVQPNLLKSDAAALLAVTAALTEVATPPVDTPQQTAKAIQSLFGGGGDVAVHPEDVPVFLAVAAQAVTREVKKPEPPSTTLTVDLGPGEHAPAIESVKVESTTDSSVTTLPAEKVAESLPEILAPLVAEGSRHSVAGSAHDVLEDLNLLDDTSPLQQVAASNPLAGLTPAVAGQPAVASTAAAPDDASKVPVSVNGAPVENHEAIRDVMEKFLEAHQAEYKMLKDGDDYIFYDPGAVQEGARDLMTVVLEFSNGSSISLVGDAHHLPVELQV